MGFETAPFGDQSTNVTSDVSNHYNARSSGGAQGITKTEGSEYESTINFDGGSTGPLYDTQQVPLDAVVTDVRGYNLTGTVSAATVGAQDISAARDDDDATWVTVTTAANLVVTGPTAGSVIVKWRYTKSA